MRRFMRRESGERGRSGAPIRLGTVLAALVLTALAASSSGNAAFPGANGKIAFSSDRDGDYEVYVMNADGTGVTQLTNNSATDFDPAWSPDGTKIAFSSSRDGNSGRQIYVMNADGTGQTRLTNTFDTNPAWSPDGTKIVFTSYRDGQPNAEIYAMNADGSGQTRLTNNGLLDFDPAWSPDGAKIAFGRGVFGGTSVIYVMNADGSGQAQLSPTDGRLVNGPDWSPDGTKIAYGGGFGFGVTADIYVINADGSDRTNLTTNPASDDAHPAWSPDGMKIAFLSNWDDPGNGDIYVMNADGTGVTRLTNSPANDGYPDWQPLVPFATFAAKVEIELGPLANEDEFEVKAAFTLGAGSNGIAPLAEDVSLEVGTFSATIPAGSLTQDEKGRFKFEGVIGGVALEAQIRPLGGGAFEFKAEGEGADLTGTANPVEVGLAIGSDVGAATVTAEFE